MKKNKKKDQCHEMALADKSGRTNIEAIWSRLRSSDKKLPASWLVTPGIVQKIYDPKSPDHSCQGEGF